MVMFNSIMISIWKTNVLSARYALKVYLTVRELQVLAIALLVLDKTTYSNRAPVY